MTVPDPATAPGADAAIELPPSSRELPWSLEGIVTVQYAVSEILAAAPSFGQAIAPILAAVGEHLGWDCVASWCRAPGAPGLRRSADWYAAPGIGAGLAAAGRGLVIDGPVGIPGLVRERARPHWFDDRTDAAGDPRLEAARADGLHTAFAFPIRSATEVFGVVEAFSRRSLREDPLVVHVGAAVGNQIGQFIERKRAEGALRRHAERQHFLAEASRALAGSLDPAAALHGLAELAVPTVADVCVVRLLDDGGALRRVATVTRDPVTAAAIDSMEARWGRHSDAVFVPVVVAREGKSQLVSLVTEEHLSSIARDDGHGDALRALGLMSFLVVPMVGRGRTVGAMSFVMTRASERRYGVEDLALAEDLGRRAGLAIENAWLFEGERRARGEAEVANRAKAEFLATMSHELRTPLNAIAGYSEILELEVHGPINDAQRNAIERIRRSQHHLLALIDDVLNFAKIEAGRIELDRSRIPVRLVLEGVDALVAPQLQAASLRYESGAYDPELAVVADADKAQQVLLNLLANAAKFTPAGGVVAVRVSADDAWVRVSVHDTGRGIPPQQQQQIFEPFVQVDRHLTPAGQQGVGLGLAISRELAEAMGGGLTVESTPGEGSTFTLTLPRG